MQVESADNIYSALPLHASLVQEPPTSISVQILQVALPTTVAMVKELVEDERSNKIYEALVANQQQTQSPTEAPESPLASLSNRLQLDTTTTTTTTPASNDLTQGFISHSVASLPKPVPSLLGVLLLFLGLFYLICGARSIIWLSHWGRGRGESGYGVRSKLGGLGGAGGEGSGSIMPGGVGGAVGGGVGIASLATLFTLLVVSRQTEPTLGGWAFITITLCSFLLGTFLGARFRWFSQGIVGSTAALSLTLLFLSSFHLPKILPRLIILAVLLPIFLLLAFLPLTSRSVTFFTPIIGSYLFILGIDTFLHLGFLDLLGLLVATDGVGMGGKATEMMENWTHGEGKGLVAFWWITAVLGSGWQWWWGGDKDVAETWNSYLGSFLDKQGPSALGTRIPARSFFSKLFSRNKSSNLTDLPGRFPHSRQSPWDEVSDEDDEEEKEFNRSRSPGRGRGKGDWASEWDADAETLRGTESVARYKPHTKEDNDEEDEEEDEVALWKKGHSNTSPFASPNSPTRELESRSAGRHESSPLSRNFELEEEQERFTPLRTPSPSATRNSDKYPPTSTSRQSDSSSPQTLAEFPPSTASLSSHPVPATPSLIYALKRVSEAQREARSVGGDWSKTSSRKTEQEFLSRSTREDGVKRSGSSSSEGKQKWKGFWEEVVTKSERRG